MTSRAGTARSPVDHRARFERWIEPELPFLLGYCRKYRLGPVVDSEDLAQEVLLRAFRAIDRFDGRHPRAWLATIARNTAINHLRRPSSGPSSPLDEQSHVTRDPTWWSATEDAAIASVSEADLHEAIDQLPPCYRSAIQLVDVGGASYREAAATLGVPIGTIMSRLHRGRRRLRDDAEKLAVATG